MYIGFDTSNYTTSVALFDGENMYQSKQLLSVKNGERGLRQSDAVFQHTVNMPILLDKLDTEIKNIDAVGVSVRPRNIDGSYMPCFLVGKNNAAAVSRVTGAKLYETSHQVGHILAALYSVKRLDLVNTEFIAFHVSGGTTEALLVKPDRDELVPAVRSWMSFHRNLTENSILNRRCLAMIVPCQVLKTKQRLCLKKVKRVRIFPDLF